MDLILFEKLHAAGIISDTSFDKIKAYKSISLFSLHWELKTILYLGILLLTGGISILVYKNIDTISHQFILLFIALLSAGSFFYCFKKMRGFSLQKVESPGLFFDYTLLLGCLTFIIFIGYLQYQYNTFGNRFGMVAFIPMVVLFFSAYYFDNIAILSLAITNLAAWAGIAVTPVRILRDNDFTSNTIILTGLLLGVLLIIAGVVSNQKKIKAHFQFTYTNFGVHILFISSLAGMFQFDRIYFAWFLLLLGISYFFYRKGLEEKSFYYILILSLYLYIGMSYVIMRFIFYTANLDIGGAYLACMYFIGSAAGLIIFLNRMNKKLKPNDSL